jgi:hypothetical protein
VALAAPIPRFHPHFTPTSSPWLNQVERWFRDLADKNLRREIFGSVPDLIARPGVAASLVGCHSQRGARKSGTDQGSTHAVVRVTGCRSIRSQDERSCAAQAVTTRPPAG